MVVADVRFVNDVDDLATRTDEEPDNVQDRCPNIPDGGGNTYVEDCSCNN